MISKTPDYVLEAHFKGLLRKARLFDWMQERMTYAEFKLPDGSGVYFSSEEECTLTEFCEHEINKDAEFQWLKD